MAKLPNRDEFESVYTKMANGEELTFEMLGDIFGNEFWIPLVYTMMDAQSAAIAIHNAIKGLRAEAADLSIGE